MTADQFAYWLQGFVELTGGNLPTPEQWKSIGEHLATVFVKTTPPVRFPQPPFQPDPNGSGAVAGWPGGVAPMARC